MNPLRELPSERLARRHCGKAIEIEDGVQYVDLQRLNFAKPGCLSGVGCVGASKVGLAASLRRAVVFLLSGMKPGTERRGVVPESIVPRRSGLFQGAIHRARTGWLRLWRGCWVVSWDEGIGKTRVFWSWGASDVSDKE
jgi:hypothetical protein